MGDDDDACTKESGKSHCLAGGNTCVQCNLNIDCPQEAPICGSDHACRSCQANVECGSKSCQLNADFPRHGECVDCTPETEVAQCRKDMACDPAVTNCPGYACDPDEFLCTETMRGTLATCRTCRSDSECGAGNKCVIVKYKGTDDGWFCMPSIPKPPGECDKPFRATPISRRSANALAVTLYCAHNETTSSCKAIRSLISTQSCTSETAEEICGLGGRCLTVNTTLINRCTYSCGSDGVCPEDFPCNEDDPTLANRYCGGPGTN